MDWKRICCGAALAAGVLLGLAGCTTAQRKTTPFYHQEVTGKGAPEKVGTAAKTEAERAVDRVNLWPAAYWRKPVGSVLWPLLTFSEDHWALWPLYSQYRQDGADGKWDEFNVLWPWAQFDTKARNYRMFPVFWGHGEKGTPYFGLVPLWWRSAEWTLTPLAGWNKNGGWLVPLAGTGGRHRKSGSWDWIAAFGIFGGGTARHARWLWTFPVFKYGQERWEQWREGKEGYRRSEFSLALGLLWDYEWRAEGYDQWRRSSPEEREISMLADFVRWEWERGTNVYARGFPVWVHRLPADYRERAGWMDADALPPEVRPIEPERRARILADVAAAKATNEWVHMDEDGALRLKKRWELVPEAPFYDWSRREEAWSMLVYRRASTLGGGFTDAEGKPAKWDGEAEASGCRMNLLRKDGIPLLADLEVRREVRFDLASGRKELDRREADYHVLGLLYRRTERRGVPEEPDRVRHRVLWKLWDWERKGEEVSLDMFPGVTWDSRADGYRKAAWLWRLFRWEKDAEGRTSVDVLFVPVWRGGAKSEE